LILVVWLRISLVKPSSDPDSKNFVKLTLKPFRRFAIMQRKPPDTQPCKLIQFHQNNDLHWHPLGDRIMGGQSDGELLCHDEGIGLFHGTVRLDNGGGFASVKADLPEPVDASQFSGIELLALGDGRTYKIGLRNSPDRRSIVYQHAFTPDTDEWGRIRLPFSDFIPTWRGKTLSDVDPLDASQIASVGLFVSERQAGEFKLKMKDWVLFKG
jgi:hypothetical protein